MSGFHVILTLVLFSSIALGKDVLISFDGSNDLGMWEESLAFAQEHNLKYTYFVSAPYFLTRTDVVEHPYWAEQEIGSMPVRFRRNGSEPEIRRRFAYLNQAIMKGHEIASHLCGHYDGTRWTYDQWKKEIEFFKWTFTRTGEFYIKHMVGVRAPNLGINDDYFKAIKEWGLRYDSSVAYGKHESYGIKEIPIRRIKTIVAWEQLRKMHERSILPFDYDFSVLVGARYMQKIFFDSLCHEYLTGQEPMQVCLHFEQMDTGTYFKAMKQFVLWVKDKDPRYLTYKDL